MKIRRISLIAVIILVFAVTLAGCSKGGTQKRLLSFFPDSAGFAWTYQGDDYAHSMTLNSVDKGSGGTVTYSISGEIEVPTEEVAEEAEEEAEDASTDAETEAEAEDDPYNINFGWSSWNVEEASESVETNPLSIEYVFTKDSVTEVIREGEGLMPRFGDAVLLKAPVKKGTKWTFQTSDWVEVNAEIIEVGKDQNKLDFVRVAYDADLAEGHYSETRTFKAGLGLVEFNATEPDYTTKSFSLTNH